MKLSENVQVETNEVKATNSRVARMARYSTAAAGVAAVSTLDVDAAMIKVIVTDTDAQETSDYYLDLGGIASSTTMYLRMSSRTSFWMSEKNASVATYDSGSSSGSLRFFNNGDEIAGKLGKSWIWNDSGGWTSSASSIMSGIFGFRIGQGSSNYTYGWLKTTFGDSSSFTLNSYGYNNTLNEAAIAG
jgi:hypothetical protein